MKIVPPHLIEVLSTWEDLRQSLARWEEDALVLHERMRGGDNTCKFIQEGLFGNAGDDLTKHDELAVLIPAKPFEAIQREYCTGPLAEYGGHSVSYPPKWEIARESVTQVTFKSNKKVSIFTKYRDEIYGQLREYVFKNTETGWKLSDYIVSTPQRSESLGL